MSSYNQPFLVKKSPIVIVKNFLVLQLTAVAVFFLAGVLADYGEIYKNLPFASSFSFQIAQALGIFFLETALVFYIFFRWYKESYDIKYDKIVYARGIIFRKRLVIPLKSISAVSYRQGPLGRLVRYGSLELQEKTSDKAFVLDHIPDPKDYAELLLSMKESSLAGNQADRGDWSGLVAAGEHERLEFKSSFRWDMNQNKINKNLERAVMKTVVAFLNSAGGQILLGVDDSGRAVGLEGDYRSLPKSNSDGFQNHFTNVFHAMIGPELRQFIELRFISSPDGKECCLVKVAPSHKPAYLRAESNEEFFIRTGNGTTGLKLSEVSSYIDSHWRGKLL